MRLELLQIHNGHPIHAIFFQLHVKTNFHGASGQAILWVKSGIPAAVSVYKHEGSVHQLQRTKDVNGARSSIQGESGESVDLVNSERIIIPRYLGQLGHTVS